MRYIVKEYLYGKYGCNPLKKQDAYDKCKKELIEFMKDNPFSFTSHLIPRTPSIPPPPPPTATDSILNRINRRNSTLAARRPNISFSLPDSFAQSNEYIPITIENIIESITNQVQDNNATLEEEEIVEENNNTVTETPYRHLVQPYSLQFQAFRPSREIPRTPPNNNQDNNNNQSNTNNDNRPFSFRLF